ncbi:MAG: hypothetical protein J7513_18305 [Solirubrobacteraceae bacterium]|nr:hypothetical protein [Solirubrobacteraceae bacterium]
MLRRLAFVCALALLPSAAPAHGAQVVKLDLAAAANATPGGVAAQSARLRARAAYVVTISGTGSLWAPADDQPVDCGTPEPGTTITEPSPGRATTAPTADAAIVFAAPRGLPFLGGFACVEPTPTAPPAQAALRMGTRGVLTPAVPIGGVPTVAAADHTYQYAVRGTGRPLQFQYADPLVYDNSGILTITIRGARECRKVRCLKRPGKTQPEAFAARSLPCVFDALPAVAGRDAERGLCR